MQLSYSRQIFYLATMLIASSISMSYAKSSSAQEGVNLLEQILQKMRDAPQIAWRNTKQTSALQRPLIADSTLPAAKNAPLSFVPVSPANGIAPVSPGPSIYLAKKAERPQVSACVPATARRLNDTAQEPSSTNAKQPADAGLPKSGFGGYGLPAPRPGVSQPLPQPSAGHAHFNYAPREYQIVDQRPLVRDFRSADKIAARGTVLGSLAGQNRAGGVGVGAINGSAVGGRSIGPSDMALLPPAVITGIPLIRLGNSEKEVSAAISNLGKLHKDLFHGWSIWSLQKAKRSDYSIQVFLRHGMVEAIRVFDSSFLRSDFGVRPGDELSSVKTKFGEPAFILSDKSPVTSQNYIYPISQVGFQLSRSRKDQSPKIVSMFIFNVK